MRIFYLHLFLLTMIASQLLCNDFSKVAAGMTKQELIHTLGPGKANAECMGDEYLFYIDRWVWLPNGIVKGYILLDNWKGPCASGTYSSQYGKFKSRAADRVTFSNVHSGMTKQELIHTLGPGKANAECMGDEYLFYIDRWVWLPNGIVKGYILLDNWKGPCASGTYSSQYGKF